MQFLNAFARYFFRGLLVVTPAVVTVYVLYATIRWLDRLLNLDEALGVRIPGLGVAVTVIVVTLIGVIATRTLAGYLIGLMEAVFSRLPFVRLIYNAIRDLLGAFVGDKKLFAHPVAVSLIPGSDARVLGFVTRSDMTHLGMADHVAVYLPQAYNYSGHLIVVPRDRTTPLQAETTSLMTFIVSGGVSGGVPGSAPGAGGKQAPR